MANTMKWGGVAWLLALSVALCCVVRADGAGDVERTRERVEAEVRLKGLLVSRPIEATLCEAVEWHAGRALWLWDQAGRAPRTDGLGLVRRPDAGVDAPSVCRLLRLLAVACHLPGQRFHHSARGVAGLRSLVEATEGEVVSAKGQWRCSDFPGRDRVVALALAETLIAADESLSREARQYLQGVLDALTAHAAESSAADRLWRARARLALAAWRRDAPAAEAEARAASGAAESWATRRPATGLEAGPQDIQVAADALAVASWARDARYRLPPGAVAWAAACLASVHAWVWTGAGFDFLAAAGEDGGAWSLALVHEAAVRCVAMSVPGRMHQAEELVRGSDRRTEWAERGEGVPSLDALAGVGLWYEARVCDGIVEGPRRVRRDRRILASSGRGFAVGHLNAGRVSVRPALGLTGRCDDLGMFCAYDGHVAHVLGTPAFRSLRPGAFRPLDLFCATGGRPETGVEASAGAVLPDEALVSAAVARVAQGQAWVRQRRLWALMEPGLALALDTTDANPAKPSVRPWRCIPGRDREATLTLDLGAPVVFDAVRVHYALNDGRWAGLAREAQLLASDDAAQWTMLGTQVNQYDPKADPPAVLPVLHRLPQQRSRFLRLAFPAGGVGNVVAVFEVEVLTTRRDEKGEVIAESANLAGPGRGCRAFAESSASTDEGPDRVIDGEARPRREQAGEYTVVLAAGERRLGFWGVTRDPESGQTQEFPPNAVSEWLRRPETVLRNVAAFHDGQVGYLFVRPLVLRVEAATPDLYVVSARVKSGPMGCLVAPGCGPDSLREWLSAGRFDWPLLTGNTLWFHDRERETGSLAVFDAVKGDLLEATGPCVLAYRMEGRVAGVSASSLGGRPRVGIRIAGIEAVRADGRLFRPDGDGMIRFDAPERP